MVKKVTSIMSNKADTKNIYRTTRNYSDRNAKDSKFPVYNVNITKISTVLLLLQSDEDDTLNHIDKFASMGNHEIYTLNENRIYDIALKLIKSENVIVKKFTYKLLVQLTRVVDDCRKKMLNDDDLIEEIKNIFMTSSDDNLVEFSCILLHFICDDLKHVDSMGRNETFVRTIFDKFTSDDTDILLQSLRLLNLIMGNSMLITSILCMKNFPLENLQIELKSDCRDIRAAALESIHIISSLCEHPFKEDFSSDRMIEVIREMCMHDDDIEIQRMALGVLKNLCRDEKFMIKVAQLLPKFLHKFMDNESNNRDEILSVLTEFAALDDNKRIMCENGIIKSIIRMIEENNSIEACNSIVVMSSNIFCLEEIMRENIYEILLNTAMKDVENQEVYLKTFLKLINPQGLHYLIDISSKLSENFALIFRNCSQSSVKFISILILEKLACYTEIKSKISQLNDLSNGIFYCLSKSNRNSKLIIRIFHLIANYIDQKSFREAFIYFDACELIKFYLQSQVNQIKASVCNLINLSSNYAELTKVMIDKGIVQILQDSDFECSFCSDGYEAMLNSDLSIKFAVRRRIEESEKIKSGFYASKSDKLNFTKMREIMKSNLMSPICPIYTINFDDDCHSDDCREIQKDENLITLKNSLCADEKFKIAEKHEKVKILAQKVVQFLQTEDECRAHNLALHLNELKFKFASSLIPIGSLIYGNSFEASLLFKALADQVNLEVSFVNDVNGKSWNQVGSGIVDLNFDIGEIYEFNSQAGRKYLQNIS